MATILDFLDNYFLYLILNFDVIKHMVIKSLNH